MAFSRTLTTLSILGLTATSMACSPGEGEGGGDGSVTGDGGIGDLGDGDGDGGIGDLGDGDGDGDGGRLDEDNPDCDSVLTLTIRDFQATHPDMESYNGLNDIGCGMVEPDIGGDLKPVFASGRGTQKRLVTGDFENLVFAGCDAWNGWEPDPVITSGTTFDQWYRDTPDVNQTFEIDIPLTDDGSGNYVYDDASFFPIDGLGYGDNHQEESGGGREGGMHNFHFTTEAHLEFGYIRGQKFTFRGDDDLWIFVNGKLALDLGGMHLPIQATIDFDAQAADLGITADRTYRMDIFHAERHTGQSNFRVETNISCFTPVTVVR